MKFRVYDFIIYIGLDVAPCVSETYNQKDKLRAPKTPSIQWRNGKFLFMKTENEKHTVVAGS